jgi:hypothetical protein
LTVVVDCLVGRGEGVGGTSIGVANVIVQVAVERGDDRTRGLRKCEEVLGELRSGSEGGTQCSGGLLTVNNWARVCRDRHEFRGPMTKLKAEPVHELLYNRMGKRSDRRATCIVR